MSKQSENDKDIGPPILQIGGATSGVNSDYRRHNDMWIPFAGEVAWVIDGEESVYWQGRIEQWHTIAGDRLGGTEYDREIAI